MAEVAPAERLQPLWLGVFWFWIAVGAVFPLATSAPRLYVVLGPVVIVLLTMRALLRGREFLPLGVMQIRVSSLLALLATFFIGIFLAGVLVQFLE